MQVENYAASLNTFPAHPPTLVWLQTALFQLEIKIDFHSRMLLFPSIFSCFSPGLCFGLFSALKQSSLSRPRALWDRKVSGRGLSPFSMPSSPLWGVWGSGQWLEVPGSSLGFPLSCRCRYEQRAKAVPQRVLRWLRLLQGCCCLILLNSTWKQKKLICWIDQFVFWAWCFCCSLSWVFSISPCESQLLCNLTMGPVPVRKKHCM